MHSSVKIFVFLIALWIPIETYGEEGSGIRAEQFIEVLSSEALTLATDTTLTSRDRLSKISKLLSEGFDMPWIARFILGRNWRNASQNEREEYSSLFKTILEHSYSRQFTDYSGQKIVILGHKLGRRDYIFVRSRIFDPERSNIHIDVNWRLVPAGNSFKIVDIVIEGVSMAVTQRNEYASVLQRNGNSIPALINAMRKSLAKLEKRR
ncbi:ABC transporter substrate-binding protein [Rhodospirillaceae bacterium]|jgi:phospholipid transport system substrate-binding protein|nr:ABC transporter substrate-binding protein [Rhodospirillaceae bacterium]|tara:strand:+ start:3648 stop:4271 length:624 start_codon:yes stop_codon:yes gene_type:complete